MARTTRWLRLWLYGLNAGLLAFAGGLFLTSGGRIAIFLMAMVPLTFVPFSYSRIRLHRLLVTRLEAFGVGPLVAAALTLAGMTLDAVMTAQLLTSRSATNISLLQSAGIAWIGPVWFSAHALLFLGYTVLAGGRSLVRVIGWLSAKIKRRTAEEVAEGVRLGPPLLGLGGLLFRALLGTWRRLARGGDLGLWHAAAMAVAGLLGDLPFAEDLGDHVGAPLGGQHAGRGVDRRRGDP